MTKQQLNETRTILQYVNSPERVTLVRYTDNVNADWWWELAATTVPHEPGGSFLVWRRDTDPVLDDLLDLLVTTGKCRDGAIVRPYALKHGVEVVDALRRRFRVGGGSFHPIDRLAVCFVSSVDNPFATWVCTTIR